MKKKICVVLGLAMMLGCMSACGSTTVETTTTVDEEQVTDEENQGVTVEATITDYFTYEFETYDGDKVVIDESNIVSQESDENPLESAKVPADAEIVAPGRSVVYLADDKFYYIEDETNGIVTIANKGESTAAVATGDVEYKTDDYTISYTEGIFDVSEARGALQFTYCKADVAANGSNMIIITKEEGTTVDDIAAAIVGEDSTISVSDGSVGSQAIPAKVFSRVSEAPEDSSLTLVDSFMVLQSGDDVIVIEAIRTVGDDDETEMTIDGAFTYTLESFLLN